MQASARANAKIRMNLQALAMQGLMQTQKYGLKLPWENLDADGGMEYERGNKREYEGSDSKLFSLDEYEHTSATDDDDVAEDEPFQDDSLNQPDDSELKDDDDDNSDPE